MKREYFIPILISVNPITYNLKSTITLVETFCYKEPTIYDIWKEKIYNRLVTFNLSESITNEILVVMSELIKEYEGEDDDDL
ncbi:MAG: hypothetical protein QFY14_02695 [Candidatus Phytoplasma pruni]|nr:hypothetical protein [Candidatus Phytoplasma pruni]